MAASAVPYGDTFLLLGGMDREGRMSTGVFQFNQVTMKQINIEVRV